MIGVHISIEILTVVRMNSKHDWHPHHDPFHSNHFPILLGIPNMTERQSTPNQRWNINKADWEKFQATLKLPSTLFSPTQACGATSTSLTAAADQSIPKTQNNTYRKSEFWWTSDCSQSKRAKNRALSHYRNHRGDILLNHLQKSSSCLRSC